MPEVQASPFRRRAIQGRRILMSGRTCLKTSGFPVQTPRFLLVSFAMFRFDLSELLVDNDTNSAFHSASALAPASHAGDSRKFCFECHSTNAFLFITVACCE
jgi:hypothetical protein